MITLDQLMNRPGLESLLVDGLISYGDVEFSLKRVPFSTIAIEGYGDSQVHCINHDICIQSEIGVLKQVWYNLCTPSMIYEKYFSPFLWLANFCKYFVDYLSEIENVSLGNFRSHFYNWIQHAHGYSMSFSDWFRLYNRADFRSVVVANVGYLWKETSSVCYLATTHPVWKQTDPLRLDSVNTKPLKQSNTLVTPYVFNLFRQMYFADHLSLCDERLFGSFLSQWQLGSSIGKGLFLPPFQNNITTNEQLRNVHLRRGLLSGSIRMYKPGQTVITRTGPKDDGKDRVKSRFAYIIATSEHEGYQLLDVLWLYQSQDTILSNMTYPFAKELFLSDKCTCLSRDYKKLRNVDIYGAIDIAWAFKEFKCADPEQYFVRQKYLSINNSFRTVSKSDLRCHCLGKKDTTFDSVLKKYQVGDVILYQSSQLLRAKLYPSLILDFVLEKKMIFVRNLERHQPNHLSQASASNVLQLSAKTRLLRPHEIRRKCHVILSGSAEILCRKLPYPYNFGGIGDYFVFKDDGQISKSNIKINLSATCRALSDSNRRGNKLRGLGLFCGGGGFDRSLELAGGIEVTCAVDISRSAIHTYSANLADSSRTKLFLGSVDDIFYEILKGASDVLPAPEEIDIVIAGSPCQGFSAAQPDRLSDASKKNASLVASVVAFIDLYRPRYALLENVISIARNMDVMNEQNVLSQILCALVGLGYQVQVFNMDAWAFGCAQKRSRLFILATAAELAIPKQPSPTHTCPQSIKHLSVGRASNGEQFGTRIIEAAVFDSVKAEDVTKDLPNIGSSHVQVCIPFPDHRLVREEPDILRSAIAMIPTCPSEISMVQAIKMGVMGERQVAYWSTQSSCKQDSKSKSYRRINSNGLFPTIMARLSPSDAFCGQLVHWAQHRVISIMEARRAQGMSDDDVLIGSPCEQWRIIGNSVPGPIGIALGLAIAEAWFTDLNQEN